LPIIVQDLFHEETLPYQEEYSRHIPVEMVQEKGEVRNGGWLELRSTPARGDIGWASIGDRDPVIFDLWLEGLNILDIEPPHGSPVCR
jgi:hypothetical protein